MVEMRFANTFTYVKHISIVIKFIYSNVFYSTISFMKLQSCARVGQKIAVDASHFNLHMGNPAREYLDM